MKYIILFLLSFNAYAIDGGIIAPTEREPCTVSNCISRPLVLSHMSLYVDGVKQPDVLPPDATTWTLTVSPGIHVIYATATDDGGIESNPSVEIVVDVPTPGTANPMPPTITINLPPVGAGRVLLGEW